MAFLAHFLSVLQYEFLSQKIRAWTICNDETSFSDDGKLSNGVGGVGGHLSQRSCSYGEVVSASSAAAAAAAGGDPGKKGKIFSKGNFSRLFKPWKWKRRKKSERFEKASKRKLQFKTQVKVHFEDK